MEIWRDIDGYEGIYQVSSLGNVRSLDRVDSIGRLRKGVTIKPWLSSFGYYIVDLKVNGYRKHKSVHQLVATAFIPNYNNYPHINHINRIRTDNRIENLEWTTPHLNNSHPPTLKYKSEVMSNREDLSKPVLQLTIEGWLFKEWQSAHQIERELGYRHNVICDCCRGNTRRKSAYGFRWAYKNKAV